MATSSLALLLVVGLGCDADDPLGGPSEVPEVDFRTHDGPGKLNTNFLGLDETHPLDNLPLVAGGEPGVQILEIRARTCTQRGGATLEGEFSTLAFGTPTVPLSAGGVLGTLTLAAVDDPTVLCTISGTQWIDTYWEISFTSGTEVIETDLWLNDMAMSGGSATYQWYVNYARIDVDYEGELPYQPTCDEDLDPFADPDLVFHSYLMKDLRVHFNGQLQTVPDTMLIACLSGAVGKSAYWGYAPWTEGFDTHQLGIRVVMADYCGNGTANTTAGTPVWEAIATAMHPNPTPPELNPENPSWVPEARWNLYSGGGASCVSMPRLHDDQQAFGQSGAFYCKGMPLPTCEGAPAVGDIVTFVHEVED